MTMEIMNEKNIYSISKISLTESKGAVHLPPRLCNTFRAACGLWVCPIPPS